MANEEQVAERNATHCATVLPIVPVTSLWNSDFILALCYCSLLGVALLIGTFGNVIIIFVTSTTGAMNKVGKQFIINLAVSDLCVAGIAEPMCIVGKWSLRIKNRLCNYENTPMQYIALLHFCENGNCQVKICIILIMFAINIAPGLGRGGGGSLRVILVQVCGPVFWNLHQSYTWSSRKKTYSYFWFYSLRPLNNLSVMRDGSSWV